MEYTLLAFIVVCATVSSTTGLQCYTCTDINIETDNDQVNELLKGTVPRDVACGEDDVGGMKLETCKGGGSSGTVVKCMKTKGEASADAHGQSVTVTTTIRSCTFVPAAKEDSCETSDDKSLINSSPGMQGFAVDDFEATSCLCGTEKCNGQTTLVPAITTCLLSLALAIYAFW